MTKTITEEPVYFLYLPKDGWLRMLIAWRDSHPDIDYQPVIAEFTMEWLLSR